jgi:RHS repeat-associated protein
LLGYEVAANARLTLQNGLTGDAGDIYTGLDRFGRLAETLWKTNYATLIQTKYGRNWVGGVVWQYNVKAHASSAATQDHYYWYDGLQQVTRHDRGALDPTAGPVYTGIIAPPQQQENFTFDETGNCPRSAYTLPNPDSSCGIRMGEMPAASGQWTSENIQNPALAQTRTHNPANQITGISGPGGAVQPAYDPAGNMTVMPSTRDWSVGDELTWDAWNRLTRVRPASSPSSSSSSSSGSHSSSGSYHSASSSSGTPSVEVTYQYDARTRRTRKTNTPGTTIDYYYDKRWRAIEERVSNSVTAQYVWSPLDRWTMIRRKRGSEIRYVLKDGLNPAAIIRPAAEVVERFGYDAFGPVRFMDASFAPRTSSAADWNFLFHAEFLDDDSGLYNYGYRYYNPQLGRWASRDPIGESGGVNLYVFVGNNGPNEVDLLGMVEEGQFRKWLDAVLEAIKACDCCPEVRSRLEKGLGKNLPDPEKFAKVLEQFKEAMDALKDVNNAKSTIDPVDFLERNLGVDLSEFKGDQDSLRRQAGQIFGKLADTAGKISTGVDISSEVVRGDVISTALAVGELGLPGGGMGLLGFYRDAYKAAMDAIKDLAFSNTTIDNVKNAASSCIDEDCSMADTFLDSAKGFIR